MRILNVSLRMRMRGGTHTGFVGEQAALCALGYGLLYGYAERTADDGLGLKRIPEDHAESFGNLGDIGEEYNKTAKEIERSHNGDELFGNGSKTIHTAKEYEARYNNQRDTGYPGRNAKGSLSSGTDGVGLNHTADKAQGQGDGHRKEPRQEGAELVLKSPLNVVNRAAGDGAVRMDHPGLLGQNGLGVNGGHPEKSDDPHPEYRTRTAYKYCAARAHYITCSDLRGNRRGKSLERSQTAAVTLSVQRNFSERLHTASITLPQTGL